MENIQKQLEALEALMGLTLTRQEERPVIRRGAQAFFDAGWPSNYFNLGMAHAAGMGVLPGPYRSFASMREYKDKMRDAGFELLG
jgi:hypothetical protein